MKILRSFLVNYSVAFVSLFLFLGASPLCFGESLRILNEMDLTRKEILILKESPQYSSIFEIKILDKYHEFLFEMSNQGIWRIDSRVRDFVIGLYRQLHPSLFTSIQPGSLRVLIPWILSVGSTSHQELSIKNRSGQLIPVVIHQNPDPKGKTYFILGLLLEGQKKGFSVYQTVKMDSNESWMSLVLRPSDDLKDWVRFSSLKQVLSEVQGAEDQTGLREVLFVGKEDDVAELAYYSKTLQDVFLLGTYRHVQEHKKPKSFELKLMAELIQGLSSFHRLGLSLGMVSPLTVGLDLDPTSGMSSKMVLADYSSAFPVGEVISSHPSRPLPFDGQGLPLLTLLKHPDFKFLGWMAPELLADSFSSLKGWMGASTEEKIANTFKSDVYSLGLLAHRFLVNDSDWYGDRGLLSNRAFHTRKEIVQAIQDQNELHSEWVRLQDSYDQVYSSLNFLLRSALDPKIEFRINAEQFAQGMKYVFEKESGIERGDFDPDDSSSESDSSILLESQYLDAKNSLIRNEQPHSYFLSTSQFEGQNRIRITFLDARLQVQSKILDLELRPSRNSLGAELQFLKGIGVISGEPLKLPATLSVSLDPILGEFGKMDLPVASSPEKAPAPQVLKNESSKAPSSWTLVLFGAMAVGAGVAVAGFSGATVRLSKFLLK